ncbi:hypothetical protein AA100600_0409 [Gluconobacter thailandicus F149-1 = NBRC 100600]|nr:hypothetical protein AA100600_0409 [Gluconobacter thailandicus F149-1 = NBRC 100600]
MQFVNDVLAVFRLCFRDSAVNGEDLHLVIVHLAALGQIEPIERMNAQACQFHDPKPYNQQKAGSGDKRAGQELHV